MGASSTKAAAEAAAHLDRTNHRTNAASRIVSGEAVAAARDDRIDEESERALSDGGGAGVPRVISYTQLSVDDAPDDGGADDARDAARKTSSVTVDGGEMDSLLKTSSRLHYGGAEQEQPFSILKKIPSFGNSGGSFAGSNASPTRVASNVASSWQPSRKERSLSDACRLGRSQGASESNPTGASASTAFGSARAAGSLRGSFALRGSFSRAAHGTHETTTIVAPEGLKLPPETPLLGSSRLAANAIRQASTRVRGDSESDSSTIGTMNTVKTAMTLKEIEAEYLEKARTTFYNDAVTFAEGTIPQSIVIATVIGIVCGVVAYTYYYVLDYFLELVWKRMPEKLVVDRWPESCHWLWIPLVTFALSACCGMSIYYLGEPGDLAYTIQCIHSKGYKSTHHILPMIAASQFSILAGASLGPEAPLVAICAATAGFLSRRIFKQTNRNVVRKHTFMGMSGALSAFFGVPLGGSLFALEVASRFGIEYFEHLVESIFAGEVCVAVFRTLAGLPLQQIWKISPQRMAETQPYMILLGAAIGLLGAGVAFLWANFHWRLMDVFRVLGLLDDENAYAVPRVLLGACGVASIGVLVPQTMFWGEWEVGTIATLSPASDLPHVWPTAGLTGFEMDSATGCLIVGFAKLAAISLTVAGGYRGGFIFPFFAAGAAFGRALCFAFPDLSPVIATLCFAAGINVAITRTALATSLILCFLSGEQFALPVVLAASIVSLFATSYVPFIKSQLARSDIDYSLYYRENRPGPRVQDSMRPGAMSVDA